MRKRKVNFNMAGGLEQFLEETASSSLKNIHGGNRTCWDVYCQLKENLKQVQENVEKGAMLEAINTCLQKGKERYELALKGSPDDLKNFSDQFFSSEHIIFLNDHGPDHISKVIDRAYALVSNMSKSLTEFETFILLCAIQIHDIGNILGRAGHEKKLIEIFDKYSQNIILDTAEKRIIKNIAMVHGGKGTKGTKDTISQLNENEVLFGCPVRTRFLAAVLRFADELSDDSTRANRVALDLGIIGTDSKIYHSYSAALHTVNIEKDEQCNKIVLVYELLASSLVEQYNVGGQKKYLLDEIYDRTLKMEQERRYCMKFMYQNIHFSKIEVRINVYGRYSEEINTITYTLEDFSYPNEPMMGSIKDVVKNSIPNGEEELEIIREKGEI